MKEIDLVYRTMFAELIQRSLDADFKTAYPLSGNFVAVAVKGKRYWYFQDTEDGKPVRRYVGPEAQEDITQRVHEFKTIKDDIRSRRKLVSTLTRQAGLPSPERFTGDVIEALANAGLFRLRGVLVGTVAFQCYSGILGVRLPTASMQTGDADFAQFHSISASVEDTLPPMLDVLRSVDETFREVPHQGDGRRSTQFANRSNYRVEFLTPNTGKSEYDGKPAPMSALGGASAQPLRFLDFLIHEPVRSVLLHKSGVPVIVPAPERYAIHKLIIASRRQVERTGPDKREKDIRQAGLIIEAMAQTRRQSDVALAYTEAWQRGPAWREAIAIGLSYLSKEAKVIFDKALLEGMGDIAENPADYGIRPAT
ncbi:hypothetical protein C5748_00670 [Phyllobacterium phragmitis]|uniref:Uncharacterized protein n=1 Tax=Phyllobacterium phragmitis TaxID=2670329 RepID=A0A2S9IYY7_9HYPH|nr:GSU2403 family nucleotidyltransferase fold protein [Phyllobacterium phragmitis]PRD45710.1 hypothetical protein C5748_00670 [Phyllobacterium phragmitis]